MTEILPRYRRDFLLPPPINRGGVDGMKEKKKGSKYQKKPAFSPVISATSLSSLSLPTVLLATSLLSSLVFPSSAPPTSGVPTPPRTQILISYRVTTVNVSLCSSSRFLLLLCFLCHRPSATVTSVEAS